MPNTKSAEKRLKQSDARRLKNRSVKSTLRTQIKKVLALAGQPQVAQAEAEYRTAAKLLDKAAANHVIHRNAAARQKSRLQRAIKAAKQRGSA